MILGMSAVTLCPQSETAASAQPLLFKGNDFIHTDILPALPRP